MVFSRKLDGFQIMRRDLNANYANRANFAKGLEDSRLLLFRAFRVK